MPPGRSKKELQSENEQLQKQINQQNLLIEELRKQIEQLVAQLRESSQGNSDLHKQMNQLQTKLDDLLFQITKKNHEEFGPKTERHNPRQGPPPETEPEDMGPFDFESGEQATPQEDPPVETASSRLKKKATKEPRARNHKKHIKSQDVPEQENKHSVTEEHLICPDCQVETTFVKYVETNQLDLLLSSIVRFKHMQETRSCPKCKEYVVTAEKPCAPIPGGTVGPCLLGSIIADKYAYALPNYRQTKRFRRHKAIIPRSTQCDWMIAASLTIEPLYELLKREVLSSKIVQTDDSWGKVQDRTMKGNIRKCKLTAYGGDKWHPLNFFDFSPDLSFDQNKETLKDFKGFVQADAANGFDDLFGEDSGRIEVACNAHSRRKYWQCALSNAYERVCTEIIEIYRDMYAVEKEIRDKGAVQRLAARQERSKPLTEKLKEKLVALKDTLPPTNPLMKAVNYTLNHWDALVRFLDDPDFEIDNNSCERMIKSWVIVRKNCLSFGSDAGGKAAAIHLSFVSSCNRLGIDPLTYLTDVYTRINSMKTSELKQLLPHNWLKCQSNKPPP